MMKPKYFSKRKSPDAAPNDKALLVLRGHLKKRLVTLLAGRGEALGGFGVRVSNHRAKPLCS